MTCPIRWELIEQNYDMLVKYATAIRVATASTEAILRRFTRNASQARPEVPVEFLSDEEAAAYGRFGGPPSRSELERVFFLDDVDTALIRGTAGYNGLGAGARGLGGCAGRIVLKNLTGWQLHQLCQWPGFALLLAQTKRVAVGILEPSPLT